MKQKVYDFSQGFSLIEVALVIAIAGLIFAMTFAILPNLMANERDSERVDDMHSLISEIKKYQQNNSRGNLPGQTAEEKHDLEEDKHVRVEAEDVIKDKNGELSPSFNTVSWGGFYRDYILEKFEDPSGYPYDFEIMNCALTKTATTVKLGAECNATGLDEYLKSNIAMQNPDPTIWILLGASCDGSTPVKAASSRKIAVVYHRERADITCTTN